MKVHLISAVGDDGIDIEANVESGLTVEDLLTKFDRRMLDKKLAILVNGSRSDLSRVLQDGDTVSVVPATISGSC